MQKLLVSVGGPSPQAPPPAPPRSGGLVHTHKQKEIKGTERALAAAVRRDRARIVELKESVLPW